MPGKQKLTDDVLKQMLDLHYSTVDIAKKAGVTERAVYLRIEALKNRAQQAAKLPAHVEQAHSSLWSTKEAAEANYQRALELLDQVRECQRKKRALSPKCGNICNSL